MIKIDHKPSFFLIPFLAYLLFDLLLLFVAYTVLMGFGFMLLLLLPLPLPLSLLLLPLQPLALPLNPATTVIEKASKERKNERTNRKDTTNAQINLSL